MHETANDPSADTAYEFALASSEQNVRPGAIDYHPEILTHLQNTLRAEQGRSDVPRKDEGIHGPPTPPQEQDQQASIDDEEARREERKDRVDGIVRGRKDKMRKRRGY
jgi:hypothetical protein